MKLLSRSIAAASVVALSATFMAAAPAHADTMKGLHGSYLGGGMSVGALGEGAQGDVGGNVTGRLDIPKAPVSLRASALFNDNAATFVPVVTGDIPIAKNTNVYLGGGASLPVNGNMTPLGDREAFVVTAGLESEVAKNLVLYGNADLGLNAISGTNDDALSFQGGAAYKF
jgi:hypothetical protein